MNNIIFPLALCMLTLIGCGQRIDERAKQHFDIYDEGTLTNSLKVMNVDGNPVDITIQEFNTYQLPPQRLDDIFETIKIVRLQTSDNCIIGEISKLQIENDTIYVLDRLSKSVLSFTSNGEFIHKYGKIGQGPGEIVELSSMSVDDKYVMILDASIQKLITYNHFGDIVSEKKIPFFIIDIQRYGENQMLCLCAGETNQHLPSMNDYCFCLCDTSFCNINWVGIYSKQEETISDGNFPLHHNGGCNYYFSNRYNTLYRINNDNSISALCHFLFDPEYPEQFNTDLDFKLKAMRENGATDITNSLLVGNVVVSSLSQYCAPPTFCFYNIDDNSQKLVALTNILSQLSRIIYFSEPLAEYKGMMIFSQKPAKLLSENKRVTSSFDLWAGAPDHVREFDKKLLESLHDEDNDILVFAKIKEHFD